MPMMIHTTNNTIAASFSIIWLAREESNLRYLSEPVSETGGFTNVAYTPMVVGLTYQP